MPAAVKSPLTYRADNVGEHSYFRDLVAVNDPGAASGMPSVSVDEARARLDRHAAEMRVEMPKRSAERERRAARQVEEAEHRFRRSVGLPTWRGLDFSPFERRTTPSRIQGNGGYFVPPLWTSDYIGALRAGRVAAGLCRNMDLPAGTDSINLPKISTGTLTGIQGADNAPVTSQDWTDTAVTANVKTIAGQTDVPIQLLDQSPYFLDQVLIQDLTQDYNAQVDRGVISGDGTNASSLNGGSLLGLYPTTNWSGANTVTWTDASPAPWKFLSVAGAMASQVAYNRFDLSSLAFLVHPRRGFWYFSGTDATHRPLVEPENIPSFNTAAVSVDSVPAEGLIGRMPFGPTVHADAHVTTADTAGAGSGQDVAIGAIWDDCWLFEGELRVRVMSEVLSGSLQVRLQVYGYVAFLVRYGQSLAFATGTGFAAPTGAVSSVVY